MPWNTITYLSFAVSLSAFIALVLMSWLYLRKERRVREHEQQAKMNIADMAILFQTMRDIVSQQKSLAKNFNQELEERSKAVQELLARGYSDSQAIQASQHHIRTELEARLEEVDILRRRMARIQEEITELQSGMAQAGARQARQQEMPAPQPAKSYAPSPPQAPAPAPATPAPVAPAPQPDEGNDVFFSVPPSTPDIEEGLPTYARDRGAPVSQPAPPTARQPVDSGDEDLLLGTGVTRAPYEAWQGEDLQAEAEPPAPVPPATPSDAEAARSAFRALLNIEPAPGAVRPATNGTDEALPKPVNGVHKPLQQRIVEYSNAGMSVAAIATELGIGKGEVRLMLNLARGAE